MGLSAFARARVSMLPESELEVERFVAWNKAHQESFRALDDLHTEQEGKVEAIREASAAAVQVIGEKIVAGLQENVEDTEDSIDQKMREDHVRDMVGRRHVVDPQGEPMSIMDRLHGRVPAGDVPHAVPLIAKTDVKGPGPTKEEMDAAYEEQEPWVLPSEEVVEEKTPPTRNASDDGGSPGHGETARTPTPAKKPVLKPASRAKDD